jgi:hypothetical protein
MKNSAALCKQSYYPHYKASGYLGAPGSGRWLLAAFGGSLRSGAYLLWSLLLARSVTSPAIAPRTLRSAQQESRRRYSVPSDRHHARHTACIDAASCAPRASCLPPFFCHIVFCKVRHMSARFMMAVTLSRKTDPHSAGEHVPFVFSFFSFSFFCFERASRATKARRMFRTVFALTFAS